MERVDAALLSRGLVESLALARALVMEGRVYLGEEKVTKPSQAARPGLPLSVRGELSAYVSRGAHKLRRALEAFAIDVAGRVCIDVGASTGGFTDVMLRQGAACVYAVDVGYGQLHWRLRSDPRVRVLERTNARFLKREMFAPAPSFGATDVSFISLKAVLPSALAVLAPGGRFVALIKPQFEAKREDVGERGVV
ncbi:MAG: TlyA family RNA methyltransferase, partial [Clostridia bacterium]|nr:TlyA family RNA methyltransferase [Clostridia bacterium]